MIHSRDLHALPLQFTSLQKIAFLCLSEAEGGLELTTIRLAEELQCRGASILVVALQDSSLLQSASEKHIPSATINPKMKYGDFVSARRLGILLHRQKIEAIVVMRSSDIHLAVIAKMWCPRLHIVFYQQMQSGINKRDVLHTWIYSHLRLWITLTDSMRTSVLQNTRMHARHVQVAHLGRDTDTFHPHAFLQEDARNALRLFHNKIIVGMLGRLDPQKGQKEFIRSIPQIRLHYPDVRFLIAGDETRGSSGYKQELLSLVHSLGIEDAVKFLPSMKDVRMFFAAIDIFVMPSYSETYGLVLIEAMAMQKPVIATNAGGVPEIIRSHQDGLLISSKSIPELTAAILYYLRDQQRRRVFAQNARRRAVEMFDSKHCVDRIVALLDPLGDEY
ncbi:MAG TPA: glycosyltransferase family 4 protein [Bacteroidota bacterium]|nr:glycosyltransferase family 4 protein [Bacteroidota bacterium]